MNEDDFERLRREDPAAYQKLLAQLPDARDGLSRQQRTLLFQLNRLGATHDRPYQSSARVILSTPALQTGASAAQPAVKMKLSFAPEPDDEPPEAYTPDLFDGC